MSETHPLEPLTAFGAANCMPRVPLHIRPAGDVTRHLADTGKARKVPGFETRVEVEETLSRCIEWFKAKIPDRSTLDTRPGEPNWDIDPHHGRVDDLQPIQS